MAFTYYDIPVPITPPTVGEMIAALTATERGNVLKAFRKENVDAERASKYLLIDFKIIDALFTELYQIQSRAKAYMRREVLVTPEVVDPDTGEIMSPAVYNTAVTSATNLKTRVLVDFSDDFNSTQISAIINAMIADSKRDGTGDWAYYSAEVIK